MNFIGISLFFSSLVGAKFYKIFTNRYAEYCENLTMNNYPRIGIKTMKKTKIDPRKNKKRVRFNNIIETYYIKDY